jgi:hypothetical protein
LEIIFSAFTSKPLPPGNDCINSRKVTKISEKPHTINAGISQEKQILKIVGAEGF